MSDLYEPIIKSMLDDDLYKINMGSVVFHMFPRAKARYRFTNRNNTPFPKGFDYFLRLQIVSLASLRLQDSEAAWLKTITYIRPTYIEWLEGYRMDPSEVHVRLTEDGALEVTIGIGNDAYWYRAIFWEVKLMAIISELYFRMTNQTATDGWEQKIADKAKKLSDAGCYWIDFGTRRRYSYTIQDRVVQIMKNYKGFLGTSNPHLAHKYGVNAHGTYAHESVMAMSALYGARMANKMWMKHWSEHFEGNVGVALTDTFTTGNFLQDFGTYEARLFDGVRQDSGSPAEWGEKMLAHYMKLGIQTSNKRFVFSDNLNVDKYIALHNKFQPFAQPVGGIGTHFTNDVGVKALNMVIKLSEANFGNGWVNVVKLSDDDGKHSGHPDAIDLAKRELGLV